MPRKKASENPRNIALGLLALLVFVVIMFPLYWILVSSIKVRADVISRVPTFIPFVQFEPTLQNYFASFTFSLRLCVDSLIFYSALSTQHSVLISVLAHGN